MTYSLLLRLLAIFGLTLFITACGRAGAPELPPSAAQAETQDDEDPEVEDKPFVLDGLLN